MTEKTQKVKLTYIHSIVYRTIVLWNYNIMESALPSAAKSGLGEVDNSTICVGVGAKAKKRKP